VSIARPTDLDGALAALAERPDANLLAGGTDLQVEINLGHRRPDAIVALRRVEELRAHDASNGAIELGAGVTYGTIERDLADLVPGLAMASRTVGSPQIRNAGTIGGNLGTSSPAGDCLPWLAALDAEVVLVSAADGERVLPIADFITGPKRNARRDDELIRAVRVPRVAGPQHVAKVGPRNAMVISVASLAIVVDTDHRRVRVGMGSVGPVPVRPTAAEDARQRRARLGLDDDRRRRPARASRPPAPTPPRPSTTTAAPPPTAVTRSGCSPPAASGGAWDDRRHHACP
jgi:CO/xanthine dehydrogenase FAD-binding subunit